MRDHQRRTQSVDSTLGRDDTANLAAMLYDIHQNDRERQLIHTDFSVKKNGKQK